MAVSGNAAATTNFGWGQQAISTMASNAASNPALNTISSTPAPPANNPQQPLSVATGAAGSTPRVPVANANAGLSAATQSQDGANAATAAPNAAAGTARHVRFESLNRMGTSSLDALTAANTVANEERSVSV